MGHNPNARSKFVPPIKHRMNENLMNHLMQACKPIIIAGQYVVLKRKEDK